MSIAECLNEVSGGQYGPLDRGDHLPHIIGSANRLPGMAASSLAGYS